MAARERMQTNGGWAAMNKYHCGDPSLPRRSWTKLLVPLKVVGEHPTNSDKDQTNMDGCESQTASMEVGIEPTRLETLQNGRASRRGPRNEQLRRKPNGGARRIRARCEEPHADEFADLERPRDIHERPTEQVSHQVFGRQPCRDARNSPNCEQGMERKPDNLSQAQSSHSDESNGGYFVNHKVAVLLEGSEKVVRAAPSMKKRRCWQCEIAVLMTKGREGRVR